MHNVAVIGAGYVGLTTAAGLAALGHRVQCTDVARDRVDLLKAGTIPIVEGGLEALVQEGLASGALEFGADNAAAVGTAEFIFLCVPTPQGPDGRADMAYIEAAAREIGPHLQPASIVVNKSTVPVGSTKVVERAMGRSDIAVVSNPEFLREGSAVQDFLHPDRIVIGADDENAATRVASLFLRTRAPVVITDPSSAETIKYASNAFLATKLSFINAIAALCESIGADVGSVTAGMGLDPRIGSDYLQPGPGWGGSCFPKDTRALVRIAEDAGYDFKLLKGTIEANDEQYDRIARKVQALVGGSLIGTVVGQWGLTFKAGTDDLRCSPALEVARRIVDAGATVHAYDPTVTTDIEGIDVVSDAAAACVGADVLLVATEWEEFRAQDFNEIGKTMNRRAILDARNWLIPGALKRAGFQYEGIGLT